MKNLWAPWRMKYILGPKQKGGCPFCIPQDGHLDREHYVVYRGHSCFVILNRYPYAAGHVMVIPCRHVSDLTQLTDEETAEMSALVRLSCRALRQMSRPDGLNVGINLGEAAGAGIGMHLHVHIVPRWNGDSNFMAVTGGVRVIPESLEDTRDRLAAVFLELSNKSGERPVNIQGGGNALS